MEQGLAKIKMNNKKAISSLVISILMIMLVTVIIVIFIGVLKNLLNQDILSSPEQCFEIQSNKLIRIEKACFNGLTDEVEVTISRRDNYEIAYLLFSVKSGEKSETWTCNKDCKECEILEGGIKTYYISIENPEKPEFISLLIPDCEIETKKIEVC